MDKLNEGRWHVCERLLGGQWYLILRINSTFWYEIRLDVSTVVHILIKLWFQNLIASISSEFLVSKSSSI